MEITVNNIVGSTKTPRQINLHQLHDVLSKTTFKELNYDPQVFSALRYVVEDGSDTVALLVFRSGKIVVVGCKSIEQLHKQITKMYKVSAGCAIQESGGNE